MMMMDGSADESMLCMCSHYERLANLDTCIDTSIMSVIMGVIMSTWPINSSIAAFAPPAAR